MPLEGLEPSQQSREAEREAAHDLGAARYQSRRGSGGVADTDRGVVVKGSTLGKKSRRNYQKQHRDKLQSESVAAAERSAAPWSDEEIEYLLRSLSQGIPNMVIANKLKRTYAAVRSMASKERLFRSREVGRAVEAEQEPRPRHRGVVVEGSTLQAEEEMKKEKDEKDGPLFLKEILRKHQISQRELCRAVKVPPSNLSLFINGGEMTGKDERAGLKARIITALKDRGVSGAELFSAFRKTSAPAAAVAGLEPEDDEWEEAEMITTEALDFFNLINDPFERGAVRSAADLYKSAASRRAAAALKSAIDRRGFVALIGEVGTGKTLLMTELEGGLGAKYRVIRPTTMDKDRLTVSSLREAIIMDLKAARDDYSERVRHSREARDRQIRDLLKLHDDDGIAVLLVIEEAHRLPMSTLRALKVLHEIQFGYSAPLAIVLIGQPELRDVFEDLRIREVTQRCRKIELPKLRKPEIPTYVKFKFSRANEGVSKVFSDNGLAAVADFLRAGASPLKVNNFVTRAINYAQELGKRKVDADLIYQLVERR